MIVGNVGLTHAVLVGGLIIINFEFDINSLQ